jgi:hypothetical protein
MLDATMNLADSINEHALAAHIKHARTCAVERHEALAMSDNLVVMAQ